MKEDFLTKHLHARNKKGLLRKLHLQNNLTDFSSNDYLGFARSPQLKNLIDAELEILNCKYETKFGSTGSRLLTGNSAYVEEVEKFIAGYHEAEAGLIFNSGYAANTGLISSVSQKEDMIFYDELSHASIYDGIRLSKAESFPFRHNDVHHLEERLEFFRSSRNGDSSCFVIVESVYSMDGDFSPLEEIVSLCRKYNANIIVDEAHATGIFGALGKGRVAELNLVRQDSRGEEKIFARVHTFGKALGCHGAIVLGSEELRNYLINYSRPFIYTTALPVHSFAAIKCAYKLLSVSNNDIIKITHLIGVFKNKVEEKNIQEFLESSSTIQSVIIKGNENVKNISSAIQKAGFDVRPILSPTVPKGKERIRICLHAFNTEEEIHRLISSIKNAIEFILRKNMVVS